MKRLLILSIFPAPYRVEVFRGLREEYEIDLFFEFVQNQNRNADWFVKSEEFQVLTTPEAVADYESKVKNLAQYDLVLAYDYFSKRAMKLMLSCMRQKVRYCINCDGAFINQNLIKDTVKRFFVSRAALCFASGQSAYNYFTYYGAKPENIRFHKFTSLKQEDILTRPLTKEERQEKRKTLGLEEKKTALTIGQFIYRKGFDILLKAWKNMEPDMQLLIVGGGDKAPEYEAYIKENNLRNVHILGFMPKTELLEYYKAADLFVLPTREDIWGLVINEAMALGLPVISSNRCIAAMELVEEGVNGHIVPVEDVNALHDKLYGLLSDEEQTEKMAAANVEKMQDNTMENIVKCHLRDLRELLS